MIFKMFQSVLDQDRAAVVLCDCSHKIVYMNAAAIQRYERFGGAALLGCSLLDCHNPTSCQYIEKVLAWFEESRAHNMIYTSRNDAENKDVYMVALRDEEGKLIGYYEKHEYRNAEVAQRYDFSKSLI